MLIGDEAFGKLSGHEVGTLMSWTSVPIKGTLESSLTGFLTEKSALLLKPSHAITFLLDSQLLGLEETSLLHL